MKNENIALDITEAARSALDPGGNDPRLIVFQIYAIKCTNTDVPHVHHIASDKN